MRVHPDLCPKPWVRKLPDYIAPRNANRWQSFIPNAPRQFETHPSQADALARIQRWELTTRLHDELRGRAHRAHPANGDRAVA